ncbi:MAG: acyl-CoA/acyl-ACP dehydrogenase [Sandarakinorhabdus sp.]|nr:acyl-CoA/acyl-ACP dehydrogenase [Sandarakinorhabdus sp.]
MRNPSETRQVPAEQPDPVTAAVDVAGIAAALAARRDSDGSVPDIEIAALADTGLLHAPLPLAWGGKALGAGPAGGEMLRSVLRIIGGGSLALGRLNEGHVNAVCLAMRYGNAGHLRLLNAEAVAGRLSAVWNAQTGDGLHLDGDTLIGGKIYTSGLGIVRRPVSAPMRRGDVVMVIPDVATARGDLSAWTPLGMRASLTGAADFTGITIAPADIIGGAGDYYRAPLFAGGAWRVLAVQLGALEQLLALYRTQMKTRGRDADPIQRARFGDAAAPLETRRLWTARAAAIVADAAQDPGAVDALVNFARHEFERAALAIIERVERGIGLSAMLRPDPVERIVRDLTTYLRQPFPDVALDAAAGWALAERPAHLDIGAA